MELKEAIEKCKKLTSTKFGADYIIDKSDKQAINIVLEELNNRIPIKYIEDMGKKINSELAMCRNYKANQIIIKKYFERLLNKE